MIAQIFCTCLSACVYPSLQSKWLLKRYEPDQSGADCDQAGGYRRPFPRNPFTFDGVQHPFQFVELARKLSNVPSSLAGRGWLCPHKQDLYVHPFTKATRVSYHITIIGVIDNHHHHRYHPVLRIHFCRHGRGGGGGGGGGSGGLVVVRLWL